jgi:hypothetical protein
MLAVIEMFPLPGEHKHFAIQNSFIHSNCFRISLFNINTTRKAEQTIITFHFSFPFLFLLVLSIVYNFPVPERMMIVFIRLDHRIRIKIKKI